MAIEADVIVVGGGAAGLTASLYAARRGLRVATLAEDIGGQAALTSRVENYPGTEPIDGLHLMLQFRAQAERDGAIIKLETAEKITRQEKSFEVTTAHDTYRAPALILAFGLTHRKLNVPGEDQLVGRGISYCSTCDAPLFRGKNVAVVGGGNSAMDAALALSAWCPSVSLITINPELRGEKVLMDRIAATKSIRVIRNAQVKEVLGSGTVEVVKISAAGQEHILPIQGLFVEIGYIVNPELLTGLVDLDEKNQVIIHAPDNSTSVPGLFAAGDITNITQKQIVISAGEGAKAGLAAAAYLQRLGITPRPITNDWTHVTPRRHEQPPHPHLPRSQK